MQTSTSGRILVVDEEENIQFLLRSALRHFGYDVDVAGDGRTALKAARSQAPDLIVLDVMLPDVDGSRSAAGCAPTASIRRCCS